MAHVKCEALYTKFYVNAVSFTLVRLDTRQIVDLRSITEFLGSWNSRFTIIC